MFAWWLSLDPGSKLLYEWLLGASLAWIWLIGTELRSYYNLYSAYLKGKSKYPPAILSDGSGRALDGEQKVSFILLYIFGPLLWFVILPCVIVYYIYSFLKTLKLFTQVLNPYFWLRSFAISKNKAAILTSPNPKVRGLLDKRALEKTQDAEEDEDDDY